MRLRQQPRHSAARRPLADHRPQSEESVYKLDGNGNLAWVDNYQVELVQEWLGY